MSHRRLLVDLRPLRHSRQFRLLFGGQMVSLVGSQLTLVAIPFQVYSLTRSSLQVGAVSLAQLVPLVLGALVGGTLGDGVDRRRLLLATSAALVVTSGALAVNAALAHPSLAAVYVISAIAAGLGGVVATAASSLVPTLVADADLLPAFSIMQLVDQVGMVAGPALSGLLIEAIHLPGVYGLDAASFVVAAAAACRMEAVPPAAGARRPGLGAVVEGLRLIAGRQDLTGAYLIDLNAMAFGLPRALFPALTETVFHGGASTLGFLYAAPGVGALAGALTTGWLPRVRRPAWAVEVAVSVWGAAIVAFGLTATLGVALGLLAVAGWADVVSAVLRSTLVQTAVSEEFRSRIASVQMAVVEGGPRLGDLEAGVVATAVSTQFAVVSGGLACIGGAVVLIGLLPGFRRIRTGG